jgi:hypothetical protein
MRGRLPLTVLSFPTRKFHKLGGRRVDTSCRVGLLTAAGSPQEVLSMKARARFVSLALVVAVVSATQSGCFWLTSQGPNLGPLAFPIPVPVYIQKQKEEGIADGRGYHPIVLLLQYN